MSAPSKTWPRLSTKPGPVPARSPIKMTLPVFEATVEEIKSSAAARIAESKKIIHEIGTQTPEHATFETTLGALDDLQFEEGRVINRIHLLQQTSPDAGIRKAAEEAVMDFQNWSIEKAYDLGVYKAVKAYTAKKEPLFGEDKKIADETIRDYRRLGLELPEKEQTKLKELQKKLAHLETQFSTHINEYHDELHLTRQQLDGLEEDFISHLPRTDDGLFKVSLQYPEYLPMMEFAKDEDVRRKLMVKKFNTAGSTNEALLNEMIGLRDEIAHLLGYSSWNDYVLEERMAKKPENVLQFLNRLEKRLKEKSKPELEILRQLKKETTGDKNAAFHVWDLSFYWSLYKKKKFEIDTQQLKEFFPLESTLQGLFGLVSHLFHLKIEEVPSGTFSSWHKDVRLFKVSDISGEGIGYFYLDLFPREGKYGHACVSDLIGGKYLPEGSIQRPVATMLCNFPTQAPSLLPHTQVETLFHEFGHILHHILNKSKFSRFAGTSVAWDFVEAPSQIMENWVWDHESLLKIARHYKDPTKTISKDFVDRMNEARCAGSGLFYLRQAGFSKSDLAFHSEGRTKDATRIMDKIMAETFMPGPENTTFPAGWGHMTGYASGYYGYLWADVMAADMFSVFQKSGLMDDQTGVRFRKEILERGSSRDEMNSLETFLGRPLQEEAFFKDLGI